LIIIQCLISLMEDDHLRCTVIDHLNFVPSNHTIYKNIKF